MPEEELEHAVRTLFSKRFRDQEKQQEQIENYDKYSGDSEKKLFEIRAKKLYRTGDWDRTEIDIEEAKQELKEIEEEKGLGETHYERVNQN